MARAPPWGRRARPSEAGRVGALPERRRASPRPGAPSRRVRGGARGRQPLRVGRSTQAAAPRNAGVGRLRAMVPRDPAFDSTLALLREGYAFLWNRCRRLRSDAFLTRLMGRRTLCLHGPEAAALFYDDARVQRRGAVPRPLGTSIFGKGALQTLDGDEHRRRKEAFLALMAPASLARLAATTAAAWRDAVRRWEAAPEIVLFDEARQVLARGVCAWAGLPLPARDVARRARDLAAMVKAGTF